MVDSKAVAVRETPGALEAQQVILTQRTPPEVIKTRKGKGGKMFSYVPHGWVTNQLNAAFNWAWSWEITEWRIIPENEPAEVFVLGRLTVHSANGDLVKSQFGASDVKRNSQGQILSIGDDLKAASSDALKKAASLLGLALDLYWNAEDDEAPEGSGNGTGDKGNLSTDPMTAYWAAVKAKGMTQVEGAAWLAKNSNDPNKALKGLAANAPQPSPALTEAPAAPKAETPAPQPGNGNSHAPTTYDDAPTDGLRLLAYVNAKREAIGKTKYTDHYEFRGALAAEGLEGNKWPAARQVEWYRDAARKGVEHVRKAEAAQ